MKDAAKWQRIVDKYRELTDGLSDMVESGRLAEGDIPDDYQWLVETLSAIAILDPSITIQT